MQTRFKDGSVMVCGGVARDAELEHVGQDSKRVCKVGVAVGKDEEGKTKWCNVVAWHDLASILCVARKGDPVMVIGKLKTREYNGKEYTDLIADFVSVASVRAVAEAEAAHPTFTPPPESFETLGEDDEELPF